LELLHICSKVTILLLLLLLLLLLQARKAHDSAAASRSPSKKLLGMLHLRKATERVLMYVPAGMRRIPVQVRTWTWLACAASCCAACYVW
jgi:hypothetical protein